MGKTPVFHHWRREAIPQPSHTSMGRLIIERTETCRGLCGPARPRGSYPRPPSERSHPASPRRDSIPELCRTSSSSACPASLGQQGRGEDWAAGPAGGTRTATSDALAGLWHNVSGRRSGNALHSHMEMSSGRKGPRKPAVGTRGMSEETR